MTMHPRSTNQSAPEAPGDPRSPARGRVTCTINPAKVEPMATAVKSCHCEQSKTRACGAGQNASLEPLRKERSECRIPSKTWFASPRASWSR